MDPLSDASKTQIAKRPKLTRDRLSELPDLALDHIFSHLFFQQAAQTSILSKRFKSFYNSIPVLKFSDENSAIFGEFFVSLMDTALSFHSRPEIDAFNVKFRYESKYMNSVNEWINFAVQKKVKSLCLNLYTEPCNDHTRIVGFYHIRNAGSDYVLPEFLYSNDDLVELVVNRCKLLNDASINWNSLRLLSLTRAKLDEELISRVLSGCPVLNTLELREWSGFDKVKIESVSLRVLKIVGELRPNYLIRPDDDCALDISGPNLVSLEVSGSLYRTKLRVSDVGSLQNATMDFDIEQAGPAPPGSTLYWFVFRVQDLVRDVLESLYLVKTLTLGGWCIKALSSCEAYNLSSPCSERQSLTLCVPVIKWDHRGIANVLQSSPLLETLTIRLSYCSDMMCAVDHVLNNICDEEYYWKSWSTISKCPVLHLKTVKVIGFRELCRSMNPLFQFLEFLLRNSRVLEEIVIQMSRYVTLGTRNEALKLLDVPTASPDAVVQFEPPHLWVGTLFM